MKLVGLTGGIGSGKSTVAKIFASLGVPILDADEVARKMRGPGTAGQAAILARFKTDERLALREILSSSPEAKRDLEAILHPLIRSESDAEIEKLKLAHPQAPCLIYEASLLIEAGRAKDFDCVVLVTSPWADRLKRVQKRDQISEDQALMLIRAQNDDAFRLPHAHFVIENEDPLPELEKKVRKVLDQIISA